MENTIDKKVNILTAYAIISTLIFGFILLTSFDKNNSSTNFDEITVKRINLVSEDGTLRMVMSNETRQHPGRMNGKDFEKRQRPAGILFFNQEGDECGGLIYYGKTEDEQAYSGMSFTMDQFKEDQVIQIVNSESYKNGVERIKRGIAITDLPTGSDLMSRMKKINDIKAKLKTLNEADANKLLSEVGNSLGAKRRLFLGRTLENESGLYLSDMNGETKIKIYVGKDGVPKFDVKDKNGNYQNILESY